MEILAPCYAVIDVAGHEAEYEIRELEAFGNRFALPATCHLSPLTLYSYDVSPIDSRISPTSWLKY